MSTTINGVTVKMGRLDADWRKHAVIVQVASAKKPGLKAAHEIDPGQCSGAQQLGQAVGAAAALATEYLVKNYGDALDPYAASRDAILALREEARLIAELARSMPEKVRRLYANRARFDGQELEVIKRMMYLIDKGENLTREEAEWVNQKVGVIHGDQL